MIVQKSQWPFLIALAILGPLLGYGLATVDFDLCSTGCPTETATKSAQPTIDKEPAEAAPEVVLPSSETVGIDELAPERPLAIVVMKGSWCSVCRKQLRVLSERHDDIQSTGGSVVGLTTESAANNRKLVEELGLSFPVVADKSGELLEETGLAGKCRTTPGVIFLDKDGEIARVHRGRYPGRPQGEMILGTLERLSKK